MSKEFAAAGFNICMRRQQMLQVSMYVRSNDVFNNFAQDFLDLSPEDFVAAATASSDVPSIRQALQKKKAEKGRNDAAEKSKNELKCKKNAMQRNCNAKKNGNFCLRIPLAEVFHPWVRWGGA